MSQKIAIIGSNSFSGSHLVDFFLENSKCEIIGLSRSPEYPALFLPYLYRKERSPRFKFFQLNINTQLPDIIHLFDIMKPEVIVNFAAQGNVQYSWNHPEHWLMTNTLGVANLVFALRDKPYPQKFVQISTPEVYGPCQGRKENILQYDPSTPYAVSKIAGDLFLRAMIKKWKFPVCFVRSTNYYGPHQQLYRIIPRVIIYLKLGRKIPLHGGGVVRRDFVNVSDVARGIDKIILQGKIGGVYHLSSGELIRVKDLVNLICRKMNFKFVASVEISNERTQQDPEYSLVSEAKTELGWEPKIGFSKGIDATIEWIEDNWDEILKYPLDYVHQQ